MCKQQGTVVSMWSEQKKTKWGKVRDAHIKMQEQAGAWERERGSLPHPHRKK
jgi:hypothetical protein